MRTFEELAGQELDALYQGALFLCGGDPSDAEVLLVDAVTVAFGDYPDGLGSTSVERWLEDRLVRSFLRGWGGERPRGGAVSAMSQLPADGFESLGSKQLFAAARSIPQWPRAAIWLVLLRRWSYAEAASVMGVEREAIVDLLRYRDVLIQEVLASRGRRGLASNGG